MHIVYAGAGELSLMAALSAGHLMKAHLAHNRKAAPAGSGQPQPELLPNASPNER